MKKVHAPLSIQACLSVQYEMQYPSPIQNVQTITGASGFIKICKYFPLIKMPQIRGKMPFNTYLDLLPCPTLHHENNQKFSKVSVNEKP